VMPFGYGVPPNAPAQPGQNTAKFGRDLIEDVIPFIDSATAPSPTATIAPSSDSRWAEARR